MAYTDIDKPTDYFETKLYTGNGSTQSITGIGFQPDFLWFKNRDETQWHQIYDVIRGIGSTSYYLSSNTSNAEASTTNSLTGVSSDGFSLGDNIGVNGSADNIVSWNWKANGAGSSNTDGSITSTVSANTTSGFSIVSYTGTGSNATVGHGLSSTPKFVTIKNRTTTGWSWKTHHVAITPSQRLHLNSTDAATTDATSFNSTAPTSSVFSVGTSIGTNGSSDNMIAYCFAEKKGFSKFGSYVGNGNADGTFVYTGFKPAFVLIKANASADWYLIDNKRSTFNVMEASLKANTSDAESTTIQDMDFLSNGFKPRSTSGSTNGSGTTYIYMCFAENPFVTSSGIPTTAR